MSFLGERPAFGSMLKGSTRERRTKAPNPFKSPRVRDKEHLAAIAELDCVACGAAGPSEAAHLRMADASQGKRPTGMSEKPDDAWSLPLCPSCHRIGPDPQHRANEREWWAARGINPVALARAFKEAHDSIRAAGGTKTDVNSGLRVIPAKHKR